MDRRSQKFQAGLLAAVLAATLQFVLWAGVLSGALGRPQPLAATGTAFCATAGPSGHHHAPGPACLLCPVCLTLSLPGALPAPPVSPPLPRLAGVAVAPAPLPPLPPPPLALAAAYPRGPPPL
jgi:hypothetical protein